MTEIINFFQNHYDELLAILGGIVSIATVIVKLTPTTKDDAILTKIINILEKFSLVNTKANQDIIDNSKSK
ncbi:MAG TPA: hypothetical protein VLL98_05255 [Rickettsiales bacterium]|nr:hypothetical protein [Rickettsiales bacterium]